jgi:hypothetical protein
MKQCKLCHETKILIKKSHIIPDFFYKELRLYNDKHQIHKIEASEYIKSKKFKLTPTGDYEGGILCQECDNELIGQLEDYGRRVLFGNLRPTQAIKVNNYKNQYDGLEFTICESVDYMKFKLFLLSILYRECITSREIFKSAEIPSIHLETIRQMLLSGNPGKVNEYPIIILSYLNDETMPRDLIFQPIKSITAERTLITFLIGGLVFIYYITNNYPDINEIKELSISPENKLTLLHFPRGSAWDFVLEYANIK